jgi:segregation and condensation protein A
VTVRVSLPAFEGPFDLLLHLVRQQEMDLDDIRVADITAQYLEFLREMQERDLELGGEFLVMAATLIQIKARQLLPTPPSPEETGEALEEILTTRDLIRQLMEYRLFKEAAAKLRDQEALAARHFLRQTNYLVPRTEEEEPLHGDLNKLIKAFQRVLRFVHEPEYNPHAYEAFSVEDKLVQLEEVLSHQTDPISLQKMMECCVHRAEVIVVFLAVLELCRLKKVQVVQSQAFDEVSLQWNHGSLGLDSGAEDQEDFLERHPAQQEEPQDPDDRPKRRRRKSHTDPSSA